MMVTPVNQAVQDNRALRACLEHVESRALEEKLEPLGIQGRMGIQAPLVRGVNQVQMDSLDSRGLEVRYLEMFLWQLCLVL